MRSTYVTENSVLLMQFRQFCSELMRLKAMVEGIDPVDTSLSSDPFEPRIEEVRQSLLVLLEQQSQRISDIGGSLGFGLFREAEYVMAVLADETMLNANWSGREQWPLLEQELFNTHASGDLFFRKLDRLLSGSSPSNDLAMIYFQALALDFKGRYRDADPRHQIDRYRRQLFLKIYGHPVSELEPEPIFPRSYESTAIDDEARRSPSPHLWWFVLCGVVAVWILASTLLWTNLETGISTRVERIRTTGGSSR
ncbi:DotU family type IV/VI secretion system protein [Tunturiibacter gelidiferens]|uniref:DotU family type IV/VI secretion system protein n=1 Tax=Tunturiibacter gelidiferens TaxID=3069689 RepID=UPI003D9B1C7E